MCGPRLSRSEGKYWLSQNDSIGILLIHTFPPVSVIQFMLFLKLTDHMFRPRQISYRFPSIIFFKRKFTPPDEELRTIPCSSSSVCLSLHGRKILSAYFLISQRGSCRPVVAWDFSLTDFPPACGVILAFFPASHLPHSLSQAESFVNIRKHTSSSPRKLLLTNCC
jgi:hypothetical protein